MAKPHWLEKSARRAGGFTLIEIMVVVGLVAVMLAIAAPNFVRFQRSSELTSTANSFIAAMAAARAEAMKRNRDAYVVPNTNGDWTSGWKVYVDMDKSQTQNSGDVDVLSEARVPTAITTPSYSDVNQFVDGGSNYVLFNGSGFPRLRDGSFRAGSIEFAYGTTMRRRVILSPAGRMWVCNPGPPADANCTQTGVF